MFDKIQENLKQINYNIEKAAEKSGRKPEEIMLLGVTKTIEPENINHLISLGVKNLGENRVQEFLEKYSVLGNCANWHHIGQLQTNKVKYIIDKVVLIHSVDSEKLAAEIDRQAKKHNKIMDILIEVNVAEEQTKAGISLSEVESLIQKVKEFDNISIKGLMTIAPFVEKARENRIIFKKLYQKFIDIKEKYNNNINMQYLSMGMTNDYEVAIEEGANIIRVGTGIFK